MLTGRWEVILSDKGMIRTHHQVESFHKIRKIEDPLSTPDHPLGQIIQIKNRVHYCCCLPPVRDPARLKNLKTFLVFFPAHFRHHFVNFEPTCTHHDQKTTDDLSVALARSLDWLFLNEKILDFFDDQIFFRLSHLRFFDFPIVSSF